MRIGFLIVAAGIAASLAPAQPAPASAPTNELTLRRGRPPRPIEIRVLSAIGMRQVVLKLGPEFERSSGYTLAVGYDSGTLIAKRVANGEAADVVLIPRAAVQQLAGAGLVTTAPIDLASSRVGLAVRNGSARPDISSPEAFKRALLDAKRIALPDPALGGSSGVHLSRIFEQLGLTADLKSKLVLASTPEDERSLPGPLVAAGKADIALHQIQELLAVPGIDFVGPLPESLQETFVFSAAVLTGAKQPAAARALVDFLQSAQAADAIAKIGMRPVRRTIARIVFLSEDQMQPEL